MKPRFRRALGPIIAGLALFLSLGAWSLASPVGASPDDDFHLASIWCGQGERAGLCEAGSTDTKRMVPIKAVTSACYAHNPEVNASCQGPEYLESGFALTETARLNAGDQYPPGYYFVTSFFSGDNIAVSTVTIRLVNSALFSALLVAAWCLLPARFRFTLAGSVALTFVPLGLFLIGSINPSSWALMSGALILPSLLGYYHATGWRRAALGGLAAVSALLAFNSRGDSSAYVVIAVLAASVLAFRPVKGFWLRAVLPAALLLAAVIAFLSAGQTGLAINGDMTTYDVPENSALPPKSVLTVLNILLLPNLWAGIFGQSWGLGWLDTPIYAIVPATGIFLFAGIMFASLKWISWRRVLALLGIGTALVVVPVYVLVQAGSLVGSEVQPRYVLPLITMFIAAAIAPSSDTHAEAHSGLVVSRVQLALIAFGLACAQSISLFSNLHRYVTSGSYNLDAAAEWWWLAGPSPFTVLAIGSLAFVVLMAIFAVGTWQSMPVSARAGEKNRCLSTSRAVV
ncbi:DUF2142 domain-containing protein [Leucobacter sp. W1153]|uniref:DUF2142 domain-containing protein n=1 Tax=Leucobacter sp. W1153 TaxID=3439064 RepID=UPI003F32AC16